MVMNTHVCVLKESISCVFNRAQMLMQATLIVQHILPLSLVVSYTISDLVNSRGEDLSLIVIGHHKSPWGHSINPPSEPCCM